MNHVVRAFTEGWISGKAHMSRTQAIRSDKKIRENMSEKQIDKMVKDSFPASDPPSTY